METKVDFFVVGAARCGTTSLYRYLRDHPDVYLPPVKELNHFSKVRSLIPDDYVAPKPGKDYHMKVIENEADYDALFLEAKPGQLKGDVSPSYLSNRQTATRIAEHNPAAKIIISLRNPVDRAYSHFLMNRSVGYDRNPSFEKALEADKKEEWSGGNRYLEWSLYYGPVKSYYDNFDASQIKLLLFEDWTLNKEDTVHELYRFLGLRQGSFTDLDKHNEALTYRNLSTLNKLRHPTVKRLIDKTLPSSSKQWMRDRIFKSEERPPELPEKIRARLRTYFSKDVEALEKLTGLSLTKIWTD